MTKSDTMTHFCTAIPCPICAAGSGTLTGPDQITVSLSALEAKALLHGYDIVEFPVSNPLGREGDELLRSAERKLRAALERPKRFLAATEDELDHPR
jgi:hypothetical protein